MAIQVLLYLKAVVNNLKECDRTLGKINKNSEIHRNVLQVY